MFTKFTKEKLSRVKLLEVTENTKIPNEPEVMKNLRYVKEGELPLDYDYSGSDITDPFEEENTKSVLSNTDEELKKARKRFNKLENDINLMNSFSEEFKQSMAEVRKEMKITSCLGYENIEEIEKTLRSAVNSPKVPVELKTEIAKILNDEEIALPDICEPDGIDEASKNGYYVNSSMWRMLESSRDLTISPSGYDAQKQKAPHWMNTPGVSLDEVDESNAKCEEWLSNQ